MKFVKKPIIIEAFKYDGDFIDRNGKYYIPEWGIAAHKEGILYFNGPELMVKTFHGDVIANINDYIIKGINKEIYPCKPDIFEETYRRIYE